MKLVIRAFVLRMVGRFERGKIGAEIANVVIAELLGDWAHNLVLSRTAAKEHQLPLDERIRLPGQ